MLTEQEREQYREQGFLLKTGLLSAAECDALLTYVRSLPRPSEPARSDRNEGRDIAAGKSLFASIGCATCHAPKLGGVAGLYSYLLLHDMGTELGDVGQYGVFTPDSSEPEFVNSIQLPDILG